MGNNDCSQPFKALKKSATGADECTFCTASQFFVRAAEEGKPGTCVDTCAYRNMTSPETLMNSEDKYDGEHTYKSYYEEHRDMILPRGICETPDTANVHCPYTYNSSEDVIMVDQAGLGGWEPAMAEKFKDEYGTFFMCYKRHENVDDCKLGEQYFYPIQHNTESDKSLFCLQCVLPDVFNATAEMCVDACNPPRISYMGPNNLHYRYPHDYHMYVCDDYCSDDYCFSTI